MNVALYLRASTVKQSEEGYSLEYQRDKLISYSEVKDWTIVAEYVDAGESGRTTKRPSFLRMVEDAQEDRFDAVLVYKLDRFSRSLQDLLNVITILRDHDVSVWSVTQAYDDTTPEGRLMRNMLGSFAQFESEMIGSRVKDGMARRAREGEWNTAPPYGYNWNGTLDIDLLEAETVREIYRSYAHGEKSMSGIAKELNLDRTTKRGGRWNPNTVRRILTNPIYYGEMIFKGERFSTGYPPIISREMYEIVQSVRQGRSRCSQ